MPIYYFIIIFLVSLLVPSPFPREGALLAKLLKFLNLTILEPPLGDPSVLRTASCLVQHSFSPSTVLAET